jgi:hypothetical protein
LKKLLRKSERIVTISALAIVGIVGLYLLSAFIFSNIQVDRELADEDVEIFILTNGVHTDIVVSTINEHFNWFKDIRYLSDTSKFKYFAIG